METDGPPFNDMEEPLSVAHSPDMVALVKSTGKVKVVV
jgi:hypothetical protein